MDYDNSTNGPFCGTRVRNHRGKRVSFVEYFVYPILRIMEKIFGMLEAMCESGLS